MYASPPVKGGNGGSMSMRRDVMTLFSHLGVVQPYIGHVEERFQELDLIKVFTNKLH